MATVFTLAPAFWPLMSATGKSWLRGELYVGRTRTPILYPNIPLFGEWAAAWGVSALDAALHNTAGDKVVLGHSMGAQVIYKWLRDEGPTSNLNPADITFYCTGCPERKYGGATRVPLTPRFLGAPVTAAYGGNGFPDITPFTVIDIARQYDWWADQPNESTPGPIHDRAVANCSFTIHLDYSNVSVNDPTNTEYVEGNVTYVTARTEPLPEVDRNYNSVEDRARRDTELRPIIESAYTRPTNVAVPQPIRRINRWLGWNPNTGRFILVANTIDLKTEALN